MGQTLHTVGYELAIVEDFIATLRDANVNCVIDVRAVPVSRKYGFSKKRLAALLAEHGIDYIHIAALGDPKPGREAAKAGRYNEFRHIYKTHLKSSRAKEGLHLAAETASKTNACLLCYERDPTVCHRTLVAEKVLSLSNLKINHLVVEAQTALTEHNEIRKRPYSRQGRAPAQSEAR